MSIKHKIFVVALTGMFSLAFSAVIAQNANHEPTSATDSDVRLHREKRSLRFSSRKSKAVRGTEHEGQAFSSQRFSSEARGTERHGKPLRKIRKRGTQRLSDARVYQRHASASGKRDGMKSRSRATRRP